MPEIAQETIRQIVPKAIEALRPSPTNPRKTFHQQTLEELADSIREHGIIQALVIRPWPDGTPDLFEIVVGERRYRAAQLAGLAVVPAEVRELTDSQVLDLQMIENLQREGVTPIEEAEALAARFAAGGVTVEELAAKIGKGKSPSYVRARLRLATVAGPVRQALTEGLITPEVATIIGRVPSRDQADALRSVTPWAAEGEAPIPVTVKRAREILGGTYTLTLAGAPFDTEEGGIAGKEACTTCPQRAGNMPDEGEQLRADVCTMPACYRDKVDAAWKTASKKATRQGLKVIDGKSDDRHRYLYGSEYVAINPTSNKEKRTPVALVRDDSRRPPRFLYMVKKPKEKKDDKPDLEREKRALAARRHAVARAQLLEAVAGVPLDMEKLEALVRYLAAASMEEHRDTSPAIRFLPDVPKADRGPRKTNQKDKTAPLAVADALTTPQALAVLFDMALNPSDFLIDGEDDPTGVYPVLCAAFEISPAGPEVLQLDTGECAGCGRKKCNKLTGQQYDADENERQCRAYAAAHPDEVPGMQTSAPAPIAEAKTAAGKKKAPAKAKPAAGKKKPTKKAH